MRVHLLVIFVVMVLGIALTTIFTSTVQHLDPVNLNALPIRYANRQSSSYGATGYKCSAQAAQQQANEFSRLLKASYRYSACPKVPIFEEIARQNYVEGRDMVVVDVGANKGYTVAEMMEVFEPSSHMNPNSLGIFLKSTFKRKLCGVCNDCEGRADQTLLKERRTPRSFTIHAVEPSEANFDLLLKVKGWSNHSNMFIHKYAASSKDGIVFFPNAQVGNEVGSIMENPKGDAYSKVESITLDSFFERNGLDDVDILKIDAEGFDPDVLRGSQQVLEQKKTKLLIFEYHKLNLWSESHPNKDTLENVVKNMDLKGYDCYLLGKDSTFRLTGCWNPLFEFRKWSNVVCAAREEHALSQMLLSYSRYLMSSAF
jgi:FkbM family methyltransferase